MFGEDDQPGVRFGTQCQRNLAGQGVTRTAIGNPDERIAEAVACQCLAIFGTREVIGGIGVRVIDMGKREKAV